MHNPIRLIGPLGKPIRCFADLPADPADVIVLQGRPGERFKVKAWESNGHMEYSARRETLWEEIDPAEIHLGKTVAAMENKRLGETDADRAARVRRNCIRSSGRARKVVRRTCKAMGATTLLTLTYRALEVDLVRVKLDLKLFAQRMQRLYPEFCFVAAFERQQRGAWHMHLACRKLPDLLPAKNGVKVRSFNVIRAVWRAVVKEREGNIDVSRRAQSIRSAARIASYIASYIAKDFTEGEKWSNRYAVYGGAMDDGPDGRSTLRIRPPKELMLGFVSGALEAIEIGVGLMLPGSPVATMRFSRDRGVFYLAAEPPLPLMSQESSA